MLHKSANGFDDRCDDANDCTSDACNAAGCIFVLNHPGAYAGRTLEALKPWTGNVHMQPYLVAAGILITAVALWRRPRKHYDGQVASVRVTALEFLRSEGQIRPYWGPLPQLAWTGLAMTLASAVALGVGGRRQRRSSAPLIAARSTAGAPRSTR